MPLLPCDDGAAKHPPAEYLGGIPEKATTADYRAVFERVLARLGPLRKEVSIYDFGHVSCAGISDIDLLFVVSNKITPQQCQALIRACRGQRHFYHGPMIATSAVTRKLGWILPGVKLRHLHGPDRAGHMERPDAGALGEILPAVIVEAAVDRWFWLKCLAAERTLDQRKAVLGMWALRRSILQKEAAGLAVTCAEQAFCDEVQGIRSDWSETAAFDSRRVLRLLGRAPAFAEALVREVPPIAGGGDRQPRAGTISRGKITLRRCRRDGLSTRRYQLKLGLRHRNYHLVDLPTGAFDFLWKLRQADPGSWGLSRNIVRRQMAVNSYREFLVRRRLAGVAAAPDILSDEPNNPVVRMTDRAISKLIARRPEQAN